MGNRVPLQETVKDYHQGGFKEQECEMHQNVIGEVVLWESALPIKFLNPQKFELECQLSPENIMEQFIGHNPRCAEPTLAQLPGEKTAVQTNLGATVLAYSFVNMPTMALLINVI